MSNFNVNINSSDVIAQMEKENNKKKPVQVFDPKNYLNVRLAPNEATKTITIRLLPQSKEGGLPFKEVHMHSIKVNKEIAESGWKSFVCPTRNQLGDSCPFCSLVEEARKAKNLTTNEHERARYEEIEKMNRARQMWVVRCIERGHEEDGVKFWMMPNSKDGAYAKIMGVWNTRWKKGLEKGVENNIFDLNNGKDLEITITRSIDGKSVINVTDAEDRTPLTDNYELGLKWINDEKQWTDLYKVKPQSYMEIVAGGGYPVWSKEENCYVDRDELNEKLNEERDSEFNANYTEPTIDYSKLPTNEEIANSGIFTDATKIANVTTTKSYEDDIPF